MVTFPHVVSSATCFKRGELPPTFPAPEDATVSSCQYPGCLSGSLATHYTAFALKNQPSIIRVFYGCREHYGEVHKVTHESGLCISDNQMAVRSGVLTRPRYAT